MTDWTRCPACALNFPPARRSSACPHALTERDSAYLDALAARARAEGVASLKFEPWKAGEKERETAGDYVAVILVEPA